MPPFEFPPGLSVSIGGPLPPQSKPYPETQLEEMFGPLGPVERLAVLMTLFTQVVPMLLGGVVPGPGAYGPTRTTAGLRLTPEQMDLLAARRVEDIRGAAQRAYTWQFPEKPMVSKALEPPITQRGMRPGSPEALATSELMAIGEPKPTETLRSMMKYMAESPRAGNLPPVGAFTRRTGYLMGRIERGGEPPVGPGPKSIERAVDEWFRGRPWPSEIWNRLSQDDIAALGNVFTVGDVNPETIALAKQRAVEILRRRLIGSEGDLSPSDRRQIEGMRELVGPASEGPNEASSRIWEITTAGVERANAIREAQGDRLRYEQGMRFSGSQMRVLFGSSLQDAIDRGFVTRSVSPRPTSER